MATREENVARVRALRAEGKSFREIAAEMGMGRSTVNEYILDPDRAAVIARKAPQGGACVDCGAKTTYRTGGPAERCRRCFEAAQRIARAEAVRRRTEEAVRLRGLGLTNREIAEAMGVTVPAVANLLSRARRKYGLDVARGPYVRGQVDPGKAARR